MTSVFWLIYCIGAVLCGIASFILYARAIFIMCKDPSKNREDERGMMPVVLIVLILFSAFWPVVLAGMIALCFISALNEKE